MTDLEFTPPKKDKRSKLRRSYAILDIAAASDAAEGEHELQVTNGRFEQPENQGHQDAADEVFDFEPTPKKKQKVTKVPVREEINANRKEYQPRKAEDKVSGCIVITCSRDTNNTVTFV